MGILDKLKDKMSTSSSSTHNAQSVMSSSQHTPRLGPESIFRYRKQLGVNLGSWFVLEKWITPGPFRNAASPGESDLDIAKGQEAKEIFERHWDEFITEDDWKWIKEHGFNSVRLPIAYYHLCSVLPDVLKDTDFEPHRNVFEGAWQRIQRAIETAGSHGLGVLVDLHAAAGAQNADDHSGTSFHKPRLFDKKANIRSTNLALTFLASQFAAVPHVIGLELLNEPARGENRLQGFYEETIRDIQKTIGPDFPIYVHDSWDTPHYAPWTGDRQGFVVLDHHLYRCFAGPDSQFDGDTTARNLHGDFANQFDGWYKQAKGNLVVGEWSGALKWDVIGHLPDQERDRHQRVWVQAQLELYKRSSAGWWFWCLKKSEGWDSSWSAKDEVQAEIMPRYIGLGRFKGPPPGHVKDQQLQDAHNSHTSYWQANGGSPNPAVFAPGFSQGWDDALLFLGAQDGPSEMGFVSQWAGRRKQEYESQHEALGKAAWEWEHGFNQGVQAAKAVCLE
ncbi:cytoplasm protein [Kockovaella imperatae]|uniref:Cytoplasm protein n=1 Tax=Kockovaella imperatae TaxID=4999 RepID=A0A1Y1U6M9_9TREE|nr:cytoplasm protein [Kockovaella imperatae]ORX33689.1 cytoplasm protein [Kockovaella imperatae]